MSFGKVICRRFGVLLTILGLCMTTGSDFASASSPARQVIRYYCAPAPETVPVKQANMLCQQVAQTLVENVKRAAIRRVPEEQTTPATASEVSVSLIIETPDTVRLVWQHGKSGAINRGEPLTLTHPLSRATAAQLKSEASSVLKNTQGVLRALRNL